MSHVMKFTGTFVAIGRLNGDVFEAEQILPTEDVKKHEPETPITPEALEAAGWTAKTPVHLTHYYPPGETRFSLVKSDNDVWALVDWKERMGIPFKNLKTMQQLALLLEMMGVEE